MFEKIKKIITTERILAFIILIKGNTEEEGVVEFFVFIIIFPIYVFAELINQKISKHRIKKLMK